MVLSGTPDQQMRALADAQHGRVAARQLIQIGMTRRMIKSRVGRGSLQREHQGVYAVGHAAAVQFGVEAAALLAYGPDALLTHHSAVWLWRFTPLRPDHIDLSLLPGSTGKSRHGIRLHRSSTLTAQDVTRLHGLPVTKPARALLEYADVATPRELEKALDEALALRKVSLTKIRDMLRRCAAGRVGSAVLAELAVARRPSSTIRSDGEELLRELILAADLPVPVMQQPLYGLSADCFWPQAQYAVEFDSYRFHSTRSAWRRDRVKDRVFAGHGIRLDRFTWEDVTAGAPATVAQITRQIYERSAGRRTPAGQPTAGQPTAGQPTAGQPTAGQAPAHLAPTT